MCLANFKKKVCCEDSPPKGLWDDLDFRSRSQLRLKPDYFVTCNISDNTFAITFLLGVTVDLWTPNNMLMLHDLNLDARSQWVGKGKTISVACSGQLSASNKRYTCYNDSHLLRDLALCKRLYGLTIFLFFF